MAASKNEIREWLERAKKDGCTHMIVAVDTFDYEDYPVFIKPGEDVQKEINRINSSDGSRLMECYKMDIDIERQLDERRAYHI